MSLNIQYSLTKRTLKFSNAHLSVYVEMHTYPKHFRFENIGQFKQGEYILIAQPTIYK